MGDYTDRYDREYCRSIEPNIHRKISRRFSNIVVVGEENIPADRPLFYAALHKSHMDYVALGYTLHSKGLPYPRIAAGENLLKGPLSKIINFFLCDLSKAGAVPVPRTKGPRQLIALRDTLENVLLAGNSVLVFPEEKDTNGNSKTGRSYNGRTRAFAPALFSAAINAANKGKSVSIIPTAVSYDVIPETLLFPGLIKSGELKSSDNRVKKLLGNLYYLFLEARTFAYDLYHGGYGNIYISFSKPINLVGFPNEPEGSGFDPESGSIREKVASLAQEKALEAEIPSIVSIISHCIGKTDERKQILEMCSSVEKALPYRNKPGCADYEKYLALLLNNEIISLSPHKGHGFLKVREENAMVVEYYANALEHLLKTQQ